MPTIARGIALSWTIVPSVATEVPSRRRHGSAITVALTSIVPAKPIDGAPGGSAKMTAVPSGTSTLSPAPVVAAGVRVIVVPAMAVTV